MLLTATQRKRALVYLCLGGLLLMVVAVTGVSARDPGGLWLRFGELMLAAGVARWLPWRLLLPAAGVIWLGPNLVRSVADDAALFRSDALLELPGLVGLMLFAALTRHTLQELEDDYLPLTARHDEGLPSIDPETGVYDERLLRPAVDAEIARSRRFGHEFALVLAGFDRDAEDVEGAAAQSWTASLESTAALLRMTRNHIDRVYRYGEAGFALLLPECGPREVAGMVGRLRRLAGSSEPPEDSPGGPLPLHFGATFYPASATSLDDMIARGELSLQLAREAPDRLQLDAASAPALPPPSALRQTRPLALATVAAPVGPARDASLQSALDLTIAPERAALAEAVPSPAWSLEPTIVRRALDQITTAPESPLLVAPESLVDTALAVETTPAPAGLDSPDLSRLETPVAPAPPDAATARETAGALGERPVEQVERVTEMAPAQPAAAIPLRTFEPTDTGDCTPAGPEPAADATAETEFLDDTALLRKRLSETLGMIDTLKRTA